MSKLQEFLLSGAIFTDASKVLAILIIFLIISEVALTLTLMALNLPISVLILPFFVIPGLFTYVIVQQEKRAQEIERTAPDFLRQLSSMLQVGLSFEKIKAEVESLMSAGDNFEIVKFEHLDVLVGQDYVNQKVDQIYNNTFFGNLAVKKPKIRQNSSGNSYTTIWALKIPTSMRLHLKEYYRSCSERCGYIEL